MFKLNEKDGLSQISLTGARGLMLIDLLSHAPHSLDEIRESFIKMGIMEPTHSNYILRIDINTLKAMGCEISRSSKSTECRHILYKHPFGLTVTDNEISAVKKAYKKLRIHASVTELIKYDALFAKIAECIQDREIREKFYGISALKAYNSFFLKTLLDDCKYKRTLKFTYIKPVTKQEVEKTIIAQKLFFRNEKFYLCGIDPDSKEPVMYHLKRIKDILGRLTKDNSDIKTKEICVKFILKSLGVAGLDDNETIIDKTAKGYIIEGKYYNEFIAMQRILSFGSDCTVIAPENFRESLILTLKSMKEIYND